MIQFTYSPALPWLICGGLLSAALILLSYWRAKGRAKWGRRLCLLCLRWLVIAGVVLCLLDPQWVEAIRHQPKSRLAVLLDTSRSMSIKDAPATRFGAAKNWLEQRFSPAVPPNASVNYYTFNESLSPLPSLDSASPTGGVTALAKALEGLLSIPSDDPLSGVIVCSDGIETTRQDPETIARLFRRKNIPIHTVSVGTTNDMRDLVVENIQVKRAVPNQAPTRIAITVRSSGYQNQTVPVQIRHDQKIVATREIKLSGGSQTIEMDFTPRQKGFQTYELSVPPQSGEWLTNNNRRVFGVEVVDPAIRVLYVEGTPQQPGSPIPEWKYLKDALLSDTNIKVRVLYPKHAAAEQSLQTADTDPDSGEKIYPVEHPTRGFPRTLADLLGYDVVIHSDIRKESFTPEQLVNMARLVEEYGGGFLMVGGNSAFGKGGYHRTILDRIIPVAMEQQHDSHAKAFRMRVPRGAFLHPVMAFGATKEENELIWTKKFPLLYGCNLVDRAKPGARVLGLDPTHRNTYGPSVILAIQDIGKGRSMAFTSDTTRSWGRDFETLWGERINPSMPLTESNCDSRYYRQFWINAVRWLAAGRIGRTNNPVTIELAQSYCLPNEPVSAKVTVRDKELKEIGTADVALLLSCPGKTNFTVKAQYDESKRSYQAELAPGWAGNFTIAAEASLKGRKLGGDRQLLVCEDADREMAELRARPDRMAAISKASGGKVLSVIDQDASSVTSLFGEVPPGTIEYRRTPLWDKSWWLGIVLGLLALEWGVRRLSGMA